jgi:formamidopyrimidine-DNA glycosylase
MFLLGLEIRKDRREKEYSMKSCYHCGKVIWVKKANLRAVNFCSSCM